MPRITRPVLWATPLIVVGVGALIGLFVLLGSSGTEIEVRRRCENLLDAMRRHAGPDILSFSGDTPEPGRRLAEFSEKLEFVGHDIEAVQITGDTAIAVVNLVRRVRGKRDTLRMTFHFRYANGEWYLLSHDEPMR